MNLFLFLVSFKIKYIFSISKFITTKFF
jgi:hypothetical protein